jgi:hypothetical protein
VIKLESKAVTKWLNCKKHRKKINNFFVNPIFFCKVLWGELLYDADALLQSAGALLHGAGAILKALAQYSRRWRDTQGAAALLQVAGALLHGAGAILKALAR